MAEAAGRVSDEAPAPVPIIYGDGVHDDSAGFQAAINGEQFEDRSGGVMRQPFDLEGARYGLIVERANLILDEPVSLARHRGHMVIANSNIQVRRGGFVFRDVEQEQINLTVTSCLFQCADLFEGFRIGHQAASPDADARAETLLRSWLTPEQLDDWVATHNFTVRGGSSGRRYRVGDCGCYELSDDGQNIAYLCFGPADWSLPSADRVLAKKLALECDEETVLRVANRTPANHGAFTFGLEAQEMARQQAQMAAMTEAVFYQGAGAMQAQAQALAQQQAQALQNAAYAGIGLQQARMNVAHAEALLATAAADLAAIDAMQARASADRQRRQRWLDIVYSSLIVVGLFAFFASILLF